MPKPKLVLILSCLIIFIAINGVASGAPPSKAAPKETPVKIAPKNMGVQTLELADTTPWGMGGCIT